MNKYATDSEIDMCIQILKLSYSKIPNENPIHDKMIIAVNHVIWMLEELKE